MKKRKNGLEVLMLPNYFKKIGIALLMILVCVLVFLIVCPETFKSVACLASLDKNQIGSAVKALLILALGLIGWSKDKNEDELIFQLRLRAITGGFLFGVLYSILKYSNMFISGDAKLDAFPIITGTLLFYIFFYWVTKRRFFKSTADQDEK